MFKNLSKTITKLAFIGLYALIMSVQLNAAEQDETPEYFLIETRNRTTVKRSPNGYISIDINPRAGEVIEIGGEVIKSPKTLQGVRIKIGNFVVHQQQSAQQVLDQIESWNHIVTQCTLE